MPRRLGTPAVVPAGPGGAGCSQQFGSAAVIGTTVISETTVQADISAVTARSGSGPGGSTRNGVARTAATQAIRAQLLAAVAQERGLSVTPGDVDIIVQPAGTDALPTQLQVAPDDVLSAVRNVLMLSDPFEQLPPEGATVTDVLVTVTVKGIQVPTRTEAVAERTAFLADLSSLTAEIAPGGGGRDRQPAALPAESAGCGADGAVRARPGSIVIHPSQTGYLLRCIVQRTGQPGVLTAASGQRRQSAAIRDPGALLLAGYVDRAGVRVDLRYGVWDRLALRVVPADDGL